MAVSPAVIKVAIALATDKRTWIAIGSIICGIILMIVGIVAAFLNIFSYDDSGSGTAPAAYVQFINNMKYAYGRLDAAIEETYPSLDREQIHAVFYTLYFGEKKNKSDQFYRDFVECFITRSRDEDGNEVVTQAPLNTALTRLSALTGKMTDTITQQQVDELVSVLRYGAMNAGNGDDTYTGPLPGAYSDAAVAKLMAEATKYIGYPYGATCS